MSHNQQWNFLHWFFQFLTAIPLKSTEVLVINPHLRKKVPECLFYTKKKQNHVIPFLVVTQSLSTNNINELHAHTQTHEIIKFYTYKTYHLNGKQNKMNIKTFKPIIFASTSDFYCLSLSQTRRHSDISRETDVTCDTFIRSNDEKQK